MTSLKPHISSTAVSSVLNRDTKQYGKTFLFDDEDDTCWNSDQGKFQQITVKFNKEVRITEIHIQFQGGFSCKQIDLIDPSSNASFTTDGNNCSGSNTLCSVYPGDGNNKQILELDTPLDVTAALKFLMLKPTDFFGRIIVYHFNVVGSVK